MDTLDELLRETQDAQALWLKLAEHPLVDSDDFIHGVMIDCRRQYQNAKMRWLAAKQQAEGQPLLWAGSDYGARLSSDLSR